MSWSIEVTGTKLGVAKRVAELLDSTAANYAGKPEADDVLACKARALALVDAMDLTTDGANAVNVTASGSNGSTAKGLYCASFKLDVVRLTLALDPVDAPAATP